MTTLFETGLKTILFLSFIFFAVFSYICLLWTNRSKKELRNILASMTVSLIHTFKLVVFSFVILSLVSLVLSQVF